MDLFGNLFGVPEELVCIGELTGDLSFKEKQCRVLLKEIDQLISEINVKTYQSKALKEEIFAAITKEHNILYSQIKDIYDGKIVVTKKVAEQYNLPSVPFK